MSFFRSRWSMITYFKKVTFQSNKHYVSHSVKGLCWPFEKRTIVLNRRVHTDGIQALAKPIINIDYEKVWSRSEIIRCIASNKIQEMKLLVTSIESALEYVQKLKVCIIMSVLSENNLWSSNGGNKSVAMFISNWLYGIIAARFRKAPGGYVLR